MISASRSLALTAGTCGTQASSGPLGGAQAAPPLVPPQLAANAPAAMMTELHQMIQTTPRLGKCLCCITARQTPRFGASCIADEIRLRGSELTLPPIGAESP